MVPLVVIHRCCAAHVQAIEAADEFFSACSSDVSGDNEMFFDVSPPLEPRVGSCMGFQLLFEWNM
jgi:hypothetical protein